jgi:hypothetical protein
MADLIIEDRTERLLGAMVATVKEWPQEKRDAFASEWRSLELAGAEIGEVQMFGSRFILHPSEDFTRHCAKWGIFP